MRELGLQKPVELAEFCGVSEGLVSQWFSGRTKLGPKPMLAFSKTPFNLEWISEGKLPKYRPSTAPAGTLGQVSVDGDEDSGFIKIKRVTLKLQAGFTGFQIEQEPGSSGLASVRRDFIERNGYIPEKLLAMEIKGESMVPTLYPGDTIIINTADTKLEDGAVFAINYEGEAVVKRLERNMGQWHLVSDNPDKRKYPHKNCRDGECIIVGRVVKKESERI
ncbi:LexA family transcriptional regulator [Massilia sp. TS11]|uniref:LexA family transcriptional regulator n=1 Tax=Massilia sp. TS11 TaxID=2908003 RepID=UPI001EDC08DA|nr:LexA family transcriptional regulator [Massilia sp. TS11]MCG2586525.1 S24 family peptidase [Massilia sp. TS11]